MADTKKPDTPEKNGQTALGGGKAPKEQAPSKEAPPVPEDKAPAPEKGGKATAPPAPEQKSRVVNVEFPSGKAASAPKNKEPKAPDAALPEKDTALKKEQEALLAALDEKADAYAKSQPRKPRAVKQKPAADKPDQADKPDKPTPRRGRPKKVGQSAPAKKEPEAPAPPPVPREAPRAGEPEQIVYLNIAELHAFKDHPFGVRDDAEMQALVESVRDKGVNQPALVRPRPDGGYEIIAGHRRQKASELAGYQDMPCIVREMTDDEAVLAMTDDNLRQRSEILPSERAVSLKMQVEAIKHQGARTSGQIDQKQAGQRSVDIVGERNGINPKQVQRYIRLTELEPDLINALDDKRLGFTPAVEISFIRPKNQRIIAVSMDGEQAGPSLSQAKRMRELDQKGQLNGDVIDGILCEQKKEVDKVIITGEELGQYFGKDKTPRQMKDQIIKLLDEWSEKEKGIAKPEKKADLEK